MILGHEPFFKDIEKYIETQDFLKYTIKDNKFLFSYNASSIKGDIYLFLYDASEGALKNNINSVYLFNRIYRAKMIDYAWGSMKELCKKRNPFPYYDGNLFSLSPRERAYFALLGMRIFREYFNRILISKNTYWSNAKWGET